MRFVSNKSKSLAIAVGSRVAQSLFINVRLSAGLYDMLLLWEVRDSNPQSQREKIYSLCGYHLPVNLPFASAYLRRRQKHVKYIIIMWTNSGSIATAVACLVLSRLF